MILYINQRRRRYSCKSMRLLSWKTIGAVVLREMTLCCRDWHGQGRNTRPLGACLCRRALCCSGTRSLQGIRQGGAQGFHADHLGRPGEQPPPPAAEAYGLSAGIVATPTVGSPPTEAHASRVAADSCGVLAPMGSAVWH